MLKARQRWTSSRLVIAYGCVSAAVLVACGLLVLVFAAPADAQNRVLLNSFNGADSTTGPFSSIDRVAFSQASDNVYVLEKSAGVVAKFDSSGAAQPFSDPSLGGSTVLSVGFSLGGDPDIAVDNSSTASDGNIYVIAESEKMLYGFDSTGAALPGHPKPIVAGDPCGVAVDPAGEVWITDNLAGIYRYDADGARMAGGLDVAGFCHTAFDAAGNLYAVQWNGGLSRFLPDGSGGFAPDPFTPVVDPGPASAVAVDGASGHVFVVRSGDVKEYDSSGALVSTIGSGQLTGAIGAAVNADDGSVYVSASVGGAVVRQFGVPVPTPPDISAVSVSNITETEALVKADIRAGYAAATYRVEYGLDESYGSSTEESASIGDDDEPHSVAVGLSGLEPNTTYHFRFVATNSLGTTVGPDRTFKTHTVQDAQNCPNAAYRVGASAELPDCRAFELVSHPDSGGLNPQSLLGRNSSNGENLFASEYTGANDDLIYDTQGTLPGYDGNGYMDRYLATRDEGGWSSRLVAPSGRDGSSPLAARKGGGVSSDRKYAFWTLPPIGASGTDAGHYLRTPSGEFELLGRGTLGEDPYADGKFISPGASHVVIRTGIHAPAVRLEPDAPPSGVSTVYDRTSDGVMHVVSLLPGDVTPSDPATYQGTSSDGSAIAFTINDTLYVRKDNEVTYEVASGSPVFGGFSADGDRLIYFSDGNVTIADPGNIFAFDVSTQAVTPIGSGGGSFLSYVSPDASHVFFVSTLQLDGDKGETGEPNLYVWDGQAVTFIAVLDPRDLAESNGGSDNFVGFRWWVSSVGPNQQAIQGPLNVPARSTPDGEVFVFQSRRSLAGEDTGGFSSVYRYDVGEGSLNCISCVSTGQQPTGNAHLAVSQGTFAYNVDAPLSGITVVANVTDDGRAVYFESRDALVARDVDGRYDVYEYRDGRVELLSYGRSSSDEFLYGMSRDGRDVFFSTRDPLAAGDLNGGTRRIYDARVNGGFPAPNPGEGCQEDGCQGSPTPAPAQPPAATGELDGPGNASGNGGSRLARVRIVGTAVRGSRLVVGVRVPAAGRISASGARVRGAGKRVRKAGRYRLALGLTPKARRALRLDGRAGVVVRVRYVARGGQRSAARVALTLRRSDRRRITTTNQRTSR